MSRDLIPNPPLQHTDFSDGDGGRGRGRGRGDDGRGRGDDDGAQKPALLPTGD